MKYVFLIISMLLAAFGQIILKKGVSSVNLSINAVLILKALFSPLIFLGLLLYACSAVTWLFALKSFPLTIAVPSLTLSYVLVFIYGSFFLKEATIPANYIGLLLIIFGVVLLNIK